VKDKKHSSRHDSRPNWLPVTFKIIQGR